MKSIYIKQTRVLDALHNLKQLPIHHLETNNSGNQTSGHKPLTGFKQSSFEWQQVVVERLRKLGLLLPNTDDAVHRNPDTRVVIAAHVDNFPAIEKAGELINLKHQLEGLIGI